MIFDAKVEFKSLVNTTTTSDPRTSTALMLFEEFVPLEDIYIAGQKVRFSVSHPSVQLISETGDVDIQPYTAFIKGNGFADDLLQ
jgi:hypothetical protein